MFGVWVPGQLVLYVGSLPFQATDVSRPPSKAASRNQFAAAQFESYQDMNHRDQIACLSR